MDRFHQVVKTDAMGQYEVEVAPNQIYMLSIAEKSWAAPAQSGFVVLPGEEIERHDFKLAPSTRVFGRVLNQKTLEPVADKFVYLTLHGKDLDAVGRDLLPNPENSRTWVCPMVQRNAMTGEDGKFEFFVGPGDYNLFLSDSRGEKFTIQSEAEKQVDLKIEVQSKKLLTGQVIDAATKQPVDMAQIEVYSRDFRSNGQWKATTATDGQFQVEILEQPAFIHVTSSDGKLGAILEVDARQSKVDLPLVELGSATGKLNTEDGSQPAKGIKLFYGVPSTM